jgi:cell division septal protein FtsQ
MKSSAATIEGLRTWQDIGQRPAAARALSPVARRNRLIRWVGWGVMVFFAALLLLLGVWALRGSTTAPAHGPASLPSALLGKFEFDSDGVLTQGWAMDFLKLHQGDSLEKLDLFALRGRLLASQQVRDASVERVLPGTLRVSVKERKPWLRVATADGSGGYKIYLVARDGTVFAGQDYPDQILNQLPWMSGIALHHAKNGGFQPVAGMDQVSDLIFAAQTHAPKIAAQWTIVNLAQFDPRPTAPLSLIKVQSGDLGELTFATTDFATQIHRLSFVAAQLEAKPMLLHGLDLSLPNQVIVQPAAPPPSLDANRLR